jgi:hypothetical protein
MVTSGIYHEATLNQIFAMYGRIAILVWEQEYIQLNHYHMTTLMDCVLLQRYRLAPESSKDILMKARDQIDQLSREKFQI